MPGSADNGRIPDAGLAARLKDGQEAAWQELCDNFGGPLFVYAFHRTGDRDIAEDVRQETLIAAARNIDSYRGEVPLFSWLCGIARNKAADEVRKRKRILDISSRVEAQIGDRSLQGDHTRPQSLSSPGLGRRSRKGYWRWNEMAETPRRDRSERDLAEALKEATAVEVPELPEGTAVFLASLARKRETAHSARIIRDQVTQDQSIQDHGLRGQLATGGLTQPRRATHRVRNSRIAPHIGPSQGEAAPLPYWAVLTPCAVLPAVVFL